MRLTAVRAGTGKIVVRGSGVGVAVMVEGVGETVAAVVSTAGGIFAGGLT